jgi:hypothetical protein
MRTSAHGITILMRQFSFEWDYDAGRMAFPIPVTVNIDLIYSVSFDAGVVYHDSLYCRSDLI